MKSNLIDPQTLPVHVRRLVEDPAQLPPHLEDYLLVVLRDRLLIDIERFGASPTNFNVEITYPNDKVVTLNTSWR